MFWLIGKLLIGIGLLVPSLAHADPEFSMQILTPVFGNFKTSQCGHTFGLIKPLGYTSMKAGLPLGANGQHVALKSTTNYRMGGFGMNSYPIRDTYISGYKWVNNRINVYPKSRKPDEYNEAVDLFLEFWRKSGKDPEIIEAVNDVEIIADWRRSTLLTFTVEGTTIGGGRIYDGQSQINVFAADGTVKRNLELDLDPTNSSLLPMQIRFPEIEIEGRKMELGLLTSRTEVIQSLPSLLHRAAEQILLLYGESAVERVTTDTPRWIESDQVGQVAIQGYGGAVGQGYRAGLNVNFNEKVSYLRLDPKKEESLTALDDLYLYLIADERVTALHQRNIDHLETYETYGPHRIVSRVRASDFVNQFYYEGGGKSPGLSERAENLKAYRKAQYAERRRIVERKRYRRLYRQAQEDAFERSGLEGTVDDYDVIIRGDVTNPNAGLRITIKPNPMKNWRIYQSYFNQDLLNRGWDD